MKNILKTYKIIIFSLLLTMVYTSCKDEELLPDADRLFRPIMTTDDIGMTYFKTKWERFKGAKQYELELSVDTFKTILRSEKTDSVQFTFSGLKFDTKYQVRLRAIGDQYTSTGELISSKYYESNVATLDFPTLMSVPTQSDIIDKSVRVKWKLSSFVYTRIDVMIGRDSVYKSIPITGTDNSAGEKIIVGLQPGTSYYVNLYEGDQYRGKKIFKTAASQVFQGDVVDLRDYPDDKAATLITQLFMDSLATAHPNGYNLILSGGVSYTLPTINIPVNVNMVTGLSFKGKAIMAVNGGFGITAAKSIGKLRFEKIFFTQGNIAGKFKTDGNYGGTYLFNLNQAKGNIDTLIIENCDIKYKRGAVRMQTDAIINRLVINNCVMDSIGGYGVINNASDLSYIRDIVVTNSTISNADKLFTCGKAAGINSITLDYNTFCFSPIGAGYILDYATNLVPGGVIMTNCLFGPGKANAAVNGMRFSTVTPPSVAITNCFKTSDLTWAVNAATLAVIAPINDLTDLAKTGTQIFNNITVNDFKVTDARLVKKVGDPRWW